MKKVLHPILASAALLLTMASATWAQGSLSATIAPTAGTSVNLTTEGVLDWSHWGINNLVQDHKAVGGNPVGLISDQTLVGASYSGAFGDNQVAFTWTDGTPTATATGSTTGIYEGGGSFTFTVPADTTARLLKVYVGGVTAGTTFTASLSDGSAPDYTDSSLNSASAFAPDANHFYGVYSIVYKAASAGKTLTITYTQVAGSGNITLGAATLQVAPTTPPAAPTNLVAFAGTNRIGLQWTASAGATSYNVKSSASATGTFTTIASNVPNTSYQDFTAINGVKTFYVVTANNIIGESGPSNVASATPQAGLDGTGITGAYYRSPDVPNPKYLASQLILTELDPQINFNVDGTRPANVPHDNIGVIWTGAVKAPVTGAYVFSTASDDGIRLYVDGALVIDNFVYQGTTIRNTAPLNFAAGTYHTIRVTWFQGGGGGVAQLSWSFPGQASQLVPTYALFPDASLFAPPAPTLTGLPAGPSSVTLNWGQPDNAVTYNLLRATTSGAETVVKTGLTGGTYTDTGLTSGTTYYYEIQAVNPKGTSPVSNEVAVAPVAPVIGAGVGLAATYYAGDSLDFTIAEATTPILYGLAPTVNYTQGNAVGYGAGPFPAGLPAEHFTGVYTGQVLAPFTGAYTFQTISDDGSLLSLDTGSGYQVIVNNNNYQGPTAVTSGSVNLVAGTKYNIKLEFAQGGGGATVQLLYNPLGSGLVIIPQTQLFPNFAAAPAIPTNLTAFGGNRVVYLNWTSARFAITYNVLRAAKTGGPYTQIATGVATTTYSDATVTNGKTYYYVVQAVNNVGPSGNSNEASATPNASVIGNGIGLAGVYYSGAAADYSAETTAPILYDVVPTVNFNAGNANVLNLPTTFPDGTPKENYTAVWSGQLLAPNTGAYSLQINIDDFAQLSLDTGSGYQVIASLAAPGVATSAPVNLVGGQKYNIKLEFIQGGGGETAQLLYNAGPGFVIIPQTQLFPNFTAIPAAPANLTAVGGSSLVNLGWSTAQGAITYNVLRASKSGGPYATIVMGLTAPSYTDGNVINGKTYYYVVQGVNNIGLSANSNEASATPALPKLALYYTFENGPSGTDPDVITDVSGSGNDGRLVGGDTGFLHDAAKGVWAGQTQDATHYIALPDALDFGNQFTFFTYVKLNNDNQGIQDILGASRSGGAGSGLTIYVNDFDNQSHAIVVETNTGPNAGNFQFKTRTAAGVFQFDGKYHSVAAVINRTAGVVSLYYDGNLVLANAVIGTQWATASGDNRLGSFSNGDIVTFASQFDEVRLYAGLLNAADIGALAGNGATVKGNIALEGVPDLSQVSSFAPLGTFHVSLRTPGTMTEVKGYDVTLATTGGSANGQYTLTAVTAGTYDVWIKGSKNLAVLIPNVTFTGTSGTIANALLPAADGNNDNSVDTSDFGVLVGGYNGDSTIPGSGYDPNADFNFDGVIDTNDFALLVGEYNNVGAN